MGSRAWDISQAPLPMSERIATAQHFYWSKSQEKSRTKSPIRWDARTRSPSCKTPRETDRQSILPRKVGAAVGDSKLDAPSESQNSDPKVVAYQGRIGGLYVETVDNFMGEDSTPTTQASPAGSSPGIRGSEASPGGCSSLGSSPASTPRHLDKLLTDVQPIQGLLRDICGAKGSLDSAKPKYLWSKLTDAEIVEQFNSLLNNSDELMKSCDQLFCQGLSAADLRKSDMLMSVDSMHEVTQRIIFQLGSRDKQVLDAIAKIFGSVVDGIAADAETGKKEGISKTQFRGYVASVLTQIMHELEKRVEANTKAKDQQPAAGSGLVEIVPTPFKAIASCWARKPASLDEMEASFANDNWYSEATLQATNDPPKRAHRNIPHKLGAIHGRSDHAPQACEHSDTAASARTSGTAREEDDEQGDEDGPDFVMRTKNASSVPAAETLQAQPPAGGAEEAQGSAETATWREYLRRVRNAKIEISSKLDAIAVEIDGLLADSSRPAKATTSAAVGALDALQEGHDVVSKLRDLLANRAAIEPTVVETPAVETPAVEANVDNPAVERSSVVTPAIEQAGVDTPVVCTKLEAAPSHTSPWSFEGDERLLELSALADQLRACDDKDIDTLCKILEAIERIPASIPLLRETELGLLTSRFKSHEDKRVRSIAKRMRSSWKELVAGEKQKRSGGSSP